MAYLTPSEYLEYCGDTSMDDATVEYASGLIDAIIGKTLQPTTITEQVKLKHNRGDSTYKGKLRYTPVVSITSVLGINLTYNGVTTSELPLASVYPMDTYGHFMFFPAVGINSMVWGTPENLQITYSYGYNDIPTDIKIVCGSMAKNITAINSLGGINGAKSISSLDFNIAMFDDTLYTSNELLILQKYKAV